MRANEFLVSVLFIREYSLKRTAVREGDPESGKAADVAADANEDQPSVSEPAGESSEKAALGDLEKGAEAEKEDKKSEH